MNPCISVARDSGSDAKNGMVGSYEKAVKAKSRRLCFGQEAERSTCSIIGTGAQSGLVSVDKNCQVGEQTGDEREAGGCLQVSLPPEIPESISYLALHHLVVLDCCLTTHTGKEVALLKLCVWCLRIEVLLKLDRSEGSTTFFILKGLKPGKSKKFRSLDFLFLVVLLHCYI